MRINDTEPGYPPSYCNIYPVRNTSSSSRETRGKTEVKLLTQLRTQLLLCRWLQTCSL